MARGAHCDQFGPPHSPDARARSKRFRADRHRDYELLVAGYLVLRITNAASRRGGAKTAAFASAKAAQRSLAESLARSLGPSKIHVSLIIIDGIVDEPSIRTKLADKLDSFFVKPDHVADTALMLTRQKPSAWTFELEARPFGETW
jgi:NAD(P)-dependent dehydrogenase (short-subunit alcohol dehydrogenase family)